MAGLFAMALLGTALPPPDRIGRLDVEVQALRSTRGAIIICLTTNPHRFPDCTGDPTARHLTMPADRASVRLGQLAPGDYALALIHDENGNGRLDTMMGLPREGVGFSRNPRLTFGAPRFADARFSMGEGVSVQDVRMKYFL